MNTVDNLIKEYDNANWMLLSARDEILTVIEKFIKLDPKATILLNKVMSSLKEAVPYFNSCVSEFSDIPKNKTDDNLLDTESLKPRTSLGQKLFSDPQTIKAIVLAQRLLRPIETRKEKSNVDYGTGNRRVRFPGCRNAPTLVFLTTLESLGFSLLRADSSDNMYVLVRSDCIVNARGGSIISKEDLT